MVPTDGAWRSDAAGIGGAGKTQTCRTEVAVSDVVCIGGACGSEEAGHAAVVRTWRIDGLEAVGGDGAVQKRTGGTEAAGRDTVVRTWRTDG